MLKIDRQAQIESILQSDGSVLISKLSIQLNCSEETIRRDLIEMEKEHRLVRTRGGAYLYEKYDKSYPINVRRRYYPEQKTAIAKTAINLIKNNDVIYLDSSTTCLTFAEELLKTDLNITVITNSLSICNVCSAFNTKFKLICLGGTYRNISASFIGYTTLREIEMYVADYAIISCPKISIKYGMTDNTADEAMIREKMMNNADKSILLMDHTKFQNNATIPFGDITKLDTIITDEELSSTWKNFCSVNNITLQVVKKQ